MNTSHGSRVRRATPHDADGLAKLRYAFRTELHPAAETEQEFVPRCIAWMQPRLAADSIWRVWVAEENGALIGAVWVQLVEKIPNPGFERECHAYLSNFFIQPHRRGAGVGSDLLRAAMAYCSAHDIDSVFLWPSEKSRALYQRHGFVPASRMFVRDAQSAT